MHFQENTSMLWVCKRHARATRQFVCVVVFTWSPRLLCLGEAVVLEWWMELGDAVTQHRRDGEPFHLCIDNNARIGSVTSNFFGGEQPDEESKNGEFFRDVLARSGTALPATFGGGRGTWQDRVGRWHRLVSTCVSTQWLCWFCIISARHPPCCFCEGSSRASHLLSFFFALWQFYLQGP